MTENLKYNARHERHKTRLLAVLANHIGSQNRIGAGALFEAVFEMSWTNKINDTRALRTLVRELREKDKTPICSSTGADGGYWLASAGSELDEFCKRYRRRAIRELGIEAGLRRITLPELLGQIMMNLKTGEENHAH
jgi:hypothetical protein